MAQLRDIFSVLQSKQDEDCDAYQLQFLDFNDDFFSRSRNFKYCRLCKAHATGDNTRTVAHHALPSREGERLCKYEEVQQWLDQLVKYKDAMARLPEIRRHVKNILQLYHASKNEVYPPVVWHFQVLFPGETLAVSEGVREEPNPAFDESAVSHVVDAIHVEYKVTFSLFMSWFELFYTEEYLHSYAHMVVHPSASLHDDLYFDDLGYISLSNKLKNVFGVDVPWQSLKELTVAQVYSRNFQ